MISMQTDTSDSSISQLYLSLLKKCKHYLDTRAKKGYQAEIPMGDYLVSVLGGFDGSLIDPATPDVVLAKKEIEREIRSALKQLPESQRLATTLRLYHDMQFDEIGQVLGCPVSTAKSRGQAGLKRLRQILSRKELDLH